MEITRKKLCKMIDHTNLKPYATEADIDKLCKEAVENEFFAVCVNQIWVEPAVKKLAGSDVKVAAVVGFPLGASTPDVKAFEAKKAVEAGASEIDMVVDIAALKVKDTHRAIRDIRAVVEASKPAHVKVILENCFLTVEEIETGCKCAVEAGAAFVKTSTGFGDFGAREEHVRLMRKVVGSSFGVKAAGGIKTYEDAVRMIEAGADRLGTSSGMAIIQEM